MHLSVKILFFALLNVSAEQFLTCNSGIKVTHKSTGFHLTSSEINWGSGSGQQSVTATSQNGDSTSMWMVVENNDAAESCAPGAVMSCDSVVRFTHLVTGKNLHSHNFRSPLTQEQEVSAFGEDGKGDGGDDWKVVCTKGSNWSTDTPFYLQHVATGKWLSSSNQARFNQQNCPNCPIVGQLEVVGIRQKSDASIWVVQRGAFLLDKDA